MLRPIAILSFVAVSATAAQPSGLAGRWKIDAARSNWSNGGMPKNMSLTIEMSFKGDQITYHSVNDTDKQKPSGLDYVATMNWMPQTLPGSSRFNAVRVRPIGDRGIEILELKDDDVIVGAVYELLPGGRRFVRRGVGKGADGKSHEYEEFFDKQ